MKEQITINKNWYVRLVQIVDELAGTLEKTEIDKPINVHNRLMQLIGYIHSLDEYFYDDFVEDKDNGSYADHFEEIKRN